MANENEFTISTEKTKAMLIYPRIPRELKNSHCESSLHPETNYRRKNELEQAYPRR
jgi:hypothetical protein